MPLIFLFFFSRLLPETRRGEGERDGRDETKSDDTVLGPTSLMGSVSSYIHKLNVFWKTNYMDAGEHQWPLGVKEGPKVGARASSLSP